MKIEANFKRKFSALPEEIKSVREEAIRAGKNPDEAETALKKKIEMANARGEIEREEGGVGEYNFSPEEVKGIKKDIKEQGL